MSAAVLSYNRPSTPVADIDLIQDWGDAGPPPPHAPRLERHNATGGLPPPSEDEIVDVEPRALFQSFADDAVSLEERVRRRHVRARAREYVVGLHTDLPLLDRIHFAPTFNPLYDYINELVHEPMTLADVTHNFKTILSVWNHGIDTADIARLETAVYVMPLMLPTGNTWRLQTFQERRTAERAGAIPVKDLGISMDAALEYMACDYLRQTFVNPRYCGRTDLPPPTVAEISAVLARQCALHMELVGFIVK